MTMRLTEQAIRMMCGRFAYEDGDALFRAYQVTALRQKSAMPPAYEASVEDDDGVHTVTLLLADEAEATCSCPVFHPDDLYCKHIAAVMLDLLHRGEDAAQHEADDPEPAARLLALFEERPLLPTAARSRFDARIMLQTAFMLRAVRCRDGIDRFAVAIETGQEKLYPVRDTESFLLGVYGRESVQVARSFTYNPEQHSFAEADDRVLHALAKLIRMGSGDAQEAQARARKTGQPILIPGEAWDELLPLFEAATTVRLTTASETYEGLRQSDGPLPLVFTFDRQADRFGFQAAGLEALTVLEAYGMAMAEGTLYRVPADRMRRLIVLRELLGAAGNTIAIPPEQAESFMSKVVAGLAKLGAVRMTESVSERLVRTPLRAKLFLDRVKERLLAGLEFHYGDFVIHPLADGADRTAADGPIVMRDGDKERHILELLHETELIRTEGGFVLADEEAEFDFLHRGVPRLEAWLEVYATTAVKERLYVAPVHPSVKVELDERTDWLHVSFNIEQFPEAEIRRILQALEEKRRYYKLPTGALLPLEGRAFRDIADALANLGIRAEALQGTAVRLPLVRGLSLSDTEPGGAVRLGRTFRALLDDLRHPEHAEAPLPAGLQTELRSYQRTGFQWMKTLARYRFGGILADEMGLGKTVQSIAFLLSVLGDIRESGQPALIVCPASLMYNWLDELRRFAPDIDAVVADGNKEERRRALTDRADADVFITSYPLLRIDATDYAVIPFHTLILDEAQAIKNDWTQTARAVRALQARHRFALTGTPIENRLDELRSISEAVFPGLFPDKKLFREMPTDAVSRRIRPFLLRRLKADVLQELPERIESQQTVPLLDEQKKLYMAYLAELRQETLKHLTKGSFRRNRIKILAGITRLRQLCCHPALFVEGYTGSSSKYEELLRMLEEYRAAGRRILVFSQFTSMLGLIARRLAADGVPYFYLDGETPARERVDLCNRFNDGERDLFLLSLKAGGTGLNLTGADTVILYDLWWNPAVEQQAADRAHRIGQRNVVHVIRLVAQGTIEEKMAELQQKKNTLIRDVIDPTDAAALTEDDIRDILSIT